MKMRTFFCSTVFILVNLEALKPAHAGGECYKQVQADQYVSETKFVMRNGMPEPVITVEVSPAKVVENGLKRTRLSSAPEFNIWTASQSAGQTSGGYEWNLVVPHYQNRDGIGNSYRPSVSYMIRGGDKTFVDDTLTYAGSVQTVGSKTLPAEATQSVMQWLTQANDEKLTLGVFAADSRDSAIYVFNKSDIRSGLKSSLQNMTKLTGDLRSRACTPLSVK